MSVVDNERLQILAGGGHIVEREVESSAAQHQLGASAPAWCVSPGRAGGVAPLRPAPSCRAGLAYDDRADAPAQPARDRSEFGVPSDNRPGLLHERSLTPLMKRGSRAGPVPPGSLAAARASPIRTSREHPGSSRFRGSGCACGLDRLTQAQGSSLMTIKSTLPRHCVPGP